jgi:hypothetical protein
MNMSDITFVRLEEHKIRCTRPEKYREYKAHFRHC